MGSVSSEAPQFQTSGSSPLYGASRQSETASQGAYSTFRSGSSLMGYYALQRENAFPERHGQPECQYYMKTGDCKFGAVCRFHHPRERLLPTPDCLLSPLGLPLRQGEPLCIFYSRYGICKFGPNCKFDHPMEIFAYNVSQTATGAASIGHNYLSSSEALTLTSEGLIDSVLGNNRRLSMSDTSREMPSANDNGEGEG